MYCVWCPVICTAIDRDYIVVTIISTRQQTPNICFMSHKCLFCRYGGPMNMTTKPYQYPINNSFHHSSNQSTSNTFLWTKLCLSLYNVANVITPLIYLTASWYPHHQFLVLSSCVVVIFCIRNQKVTVVPSCWCRIGPVCNQAIR